MNNINATRTTTTTEAHDSSSSYNYNFKCVGTTGNNASPIRRHSIPRPNFFRHADFSPDGTTVLTHSEDQALRTFILPPDLLETEGRNGIPHHLSPYAEFHPATPLTSFAFHPAYHLADPHSTTVLTACRDLPLTLRNTLYPDVVHATYPLTNSATEAHIAASSLAWHHDGARFVVGARNLVAVLDASRSAGDEPLRSFKTAAGRREKSLVGSGSRQGCSGIVSALAIAPDQNLAAGTLERHVALFDHAGLGAWHTSFSLHAFPGDGEPDVAPGRGITALKWSPCGAYLLVAERGSDCLQLFDMRHTRARLSLLSHRHASTMQRLGVDIVPSREGFEVWAAGTDGCVRMWANPGARQGELRPDVVAHLHGDTVSSSVWHPSGTVLATCSGSRLENRTHSIRVGANGGVKKRGVNDDDDDDDSTSSGDSSLSNGAGPSGTGHVTDASLKIWTI